MAYNLGFTPQSASDRHLFVSCGRQNPSEAAPIAEQLSRQVPVWYDNGTASTDSGQDEVTQQLAGSRAVVFFADSNLFAGEDTDMCNELALAKIYSKPRICVWCEDMSQFDVRRLSDGMYNLWLDLKNMPAVNAYENASVADAVAAILSATGATAAEAPAFDTADSQSAFPDDDFPDITSASALGTAAFGAVNAEFNAFGTDSFTDTAANTANNTAPSFEPLPVQTAAANYQTNPSPAAPSYTAAAETQTKRNRRPLLIVILIVILVVLCLFLFTMCSKITGMSIMPDFTGSTESNAPSESALPGEKPEYVADIQSADQMSVNDEVKFGKFENQEIEWIVLDKDGDNLLLLSKNVLTELPFDDSYDLPSLSTPQQRALYQNYNHITPFGEYQINKIEFDIHWDNCSLREWLNGEFLSTAFTSDEQNKINKTYVYTPDTEVKPELEDITPFTTYTINGGDDTSDYVFLLSAEECDAYFPSLTDRITNTDWWLRSKGYIFIHRDVVVNNSKQDIQQFIYDDMAQIVDESGHPLTTSGVNDANEHFYGVGSNIFSELGVRPAIWINVG